MRCTFCTDVSRTGEVVFEDDATWVVLHEDWSVPGHAMIVHKRHVQNVSDLDDGEWTHFSTVWRRAERVLLDLTGCERAVILKLGILTPHLHVHIYPVQATTTVEEVFAAVDRKVRAVRDEALVMAVRTTLNLTPDPR